MSRRRLMPARYAARNLPAPQHAASFAGWRHPLPRTHPQVLSLFSSGREEDKMVGYLSFLKIGPKLLKFLPGKPRRRSRF